MIIETAINTVNSRGNNSLHTALETMYFDQKDDEKSLDRKINQCKNVLSILNGEVNLTLKNKVGQTPLYLAVANNNLMFVKALYILLFVKKLVIITISP